FLHANCGQRIAYHKHCPSHGRVEADAIVRGYAYARGRHVVVEPEELYPAQVRPAKAWESDAPACAASAAELDLAGKLIAMGSAPLDWPRYRDTSAEELAALIEAKVANQSPAAGMPDEPVAVLPLLDALKQSVAAAGNGKTSEPPAKGRKPRARRATG